MTLAHARPGHTLERHDGDDWRMIEIVAAFVETGLRGRPSAWPTTVSAVFESQLGVTFDGGASYKRGRCHQRADNVCRAGGRLDHGVGATTIMLPQFQVFGQIGRFDKPSCSGQEPHRNSAAPVGASRCPRAHVQARSS